MNQQLKRFSDNRGLNEIDYKILKTINTSKLSEKEIIKELLLWQQEETVYGFGDLQYYTRLNKLDGFYEIKEEKHYLNSKGKEVLAD